MKKIRVGVIFGGQSAEHEVSLQSAKNVIASLDREKYEPLLIGIDKEGKWHLQDEGSFLLHATDPSRVVLHTSSENVSLIPWKSAANIQSVTQNLGLDVIFPVLHGPYGEDGTIQGLLKLAHLPFVGAGVLGSAVGMDKDVMKRLLKSEGLPVGKFLVFREHERKTISYDELKKSLGIPFFVKPANLGSSVGVSKVHSDKEFEKAIDDAFSYDTKILIEEFIDGREIECAVLGNENPEASVAGEIIPTHEFYSYDAKYIDEKGAKLVIPAMLSGETLSEVQELATKTFEVLCCEGMARVDFFLTKDGKLFVNEINTIPGFTKISMYPKLWEASGVMYTELIDRLITLAINRFEKEQQLKTHQSEKR
ncbi:MAG: D-alanine--D-alanine ligase [Candidatus Parcubacteria bacterium]|jgi:D-alanine-D-alanine ligase